MPKKPPISSAPPKVSVAEDIIKNNSVKENNITTEKKRQKNKLNKYIVTLTFPPEMEDKFKKEAEERGMTVAGFLKFCAAKEINK